jgi:hypothetical protein
VYDLACKLNRSEKSTSSAVTREGVNFDRACLACNLFLLSPDALSPPVAPSSASDSECETAEVS